MKIFFASDHGGYELKQSLIDVFSSSDYIIKDLGTHTAQESSDYPDYARILATEILKAQHHTHVDQDIELDRNYDDDHDYQTNLYPDKNILGIAICGTGIGMSMALNKYPHIRSALCHTPFEAVLAKQHNHANVLNFGGRTTSKVQAELCIKAFLDASYEEGRHDRRLQKYYKSYNIADKTVYEMIGQEVKRQQNTIDLIASENMVDEEILNAQGSVFTNKYAEGYSRHRYYGGCDVVDDLEELAINRLKKIYGCTYANVQPHSGAIANMAALYTLAKSGDTIMGLSLDHGGHLTHGSHVNYSGKWFNAVPYYLNPTTHVLDYDAIEQLANTHHPKIIIAGYSAYPRFIDFQRFRQICDKVGAALLVDMAHISGLIAAQCFPNPVSYADIVTSTTHKTLRGARGGIILTNREDLAKKINKSIFPMIQGGPLMNEIAGKAVAFYKAAQPEFKVYITNLLANMRSMAEVFQERNISLITGGTDTHLILLNLQPHGLTGQAVEQALGSMNIIVNKNMIPGDTQSPQVTSGIRIGASAITSRYFNTQQASSIAHYIADTIDALKNNQFSKIQKNIQHGVQELCKNHPIYPGYIS